MLYSRPLSYLDRPSQLLFSDSPPAPSQGCVLLSKLLSGVPRFCRYLAIDRPSNAHVQPDLPAPQTSRVLGALPKHTSGRRARPVCRAVNHPTV